MGIYDSWDVECHLTPTGWVEGSELEFDRQVKDFPPPEDRLLTLKVSSRQSSGWSRTDVPILPAMRRAVISDAKTDESLPRFQSAIVAPSGQGVLPPTFGWRFCASR